ncbi:MAG: glycosyltransferase family 4 protein [Planctomycetes bacterium]|nr:glycosyltransferase family 4 protein [Planctomycetota bacterium]
MRIIVTSAAPPWPLHNGCRLHCYELCRRLARRHELLYVAERPAEEPLPAFNFECRVAQGGRLLSDPVDLAAEGLSANRWERFFGINLEYTRDLVHLTRTWRPDVVIGVAPQSLAPLARIENVPTICDLVDDEALHRLLELLFGVGMSKWRDLKTFLAALLYQRGHYRQIDAITVVSRRDQRFAQFFAPAGRVHYIPHGVDCAHYAPANTTEDDNRIVFWGGLDFGPNISAVRFFAERVWPLLRRRRPGMRWWILGKGNPPQLRHLRGIGGIDWVGHVPDIRPYIAEAAVVVVPMRTGAGIKNKIMEGWAMGKAVLCTPHAVGSLPARHGENTWIARAPRAQANGLLSLSKDRAMRAAIGRAARQTAETHCSWEGAATRLDNLCFTLAGTGVRRDGGASSRPVHKSGSALPRLEQIGSPRD